MAHEHDSRNDSPQQSKAKWIFIGFLLIAGFFLIAEHRAHLAGWMSAYGIWLFLLACPLMHLFMHHGHGDDSEHPPRKDNRRESE